MTSRLFYRIVVPTDFSGGSEEAWALAQRIAGALGSELVLVHVFVEPPSYGEASLPLDTGWQEPGGGRDARPFGTQAVDREAKSVGTVSRRWHRQPALAPSADGSFIRYLRSWVAFGIVYRPVAEAAGTG